MSGRSHAAPHTMIGYRFLHSHVEKRVVQLVFLINFILEF